MISREPSNTSISDLLRAVHKMIVEIEVSSLRAANDSLIGQIKWSARKVDSVSESREQIDGVCFEDIAEVSGVTIGMKNQTSATTLCLMI